MKHSYALFLLCLLAATGCGKKEKDPEPELIGRWEYNQMQITHYNRDGTLDYVTPWKPVPGSIVMTVTADSMITRTDQSPLITVIREGYVRDGNVLNLTAKRGPLVSKYSVTIDELTAQRFVYHSDDFYPTSAGGGIYDRTSIVHTR